MAAPTVTINQGGSQVDPTNGSPILFDVVFSEPVTGFDASDIDFSGSTAGGTLNANVTGSGPTYTVSVTGMTTSGFVFASIPAGAATDVDEANLSLASTSTDHVVSFDNVAPTVTINQGGGQVDPTNGSPILFDVVFNEAVTGFDAGDIGFSGSTAGGTLIANVTGSGPDYTVSVTGMTSSGAVTASIIAGAATDLVGNLNSASTSTDNTVNFVGTADLSITKTDGTTFAVPGTLTTYTILLSNFGPSAVTGASVFDPLPAGVIGADWAFAGSTGGGNVSGPLSGTGALATTVNLPVNATITFSYTVQVDPSATGSLANTATISPPAGTTDTIGGNNASTDTDTLLRHADLSITKTDGTTSAVPGTPTTYTIVVSNFGPSAVTGAGVFDPLPAGVTDATWAFVGSTGGGNVSGPLSGTGALATTVNLPVNATITYSYTVQVDPSATGLLASTAEIIPLADTTEINPGNNAATDTDTLTPQADLAITKTDGTTSVAPGTPNTYTIVVSNFGPSAVIGASVFDPLPAGVTDATWAFSGSVGGGFASDFFGTGALATTVNLPVNASVIFNYTVQIDPSATGSLVNAATVSPPAGTTDSNPANNAATDVDTLTPPQADLAITKTDGTTSVAPGTPNTYTIVVSNFGPSAVIGASVFDPLPAGVTDATWAFSGSVGGGFASDFFGTGALATTVNLPVNASVIFNYTVQIDPSATGSLVNAATVSPPAGTTDSNPANNAATDVDLFGTPAINLVKFVNGQDADSAPGPHVAPGSTVTFTYVVTNTGSVPLINVVLADDKLGPITSFTGDTNGNGLLDLTETWTYTKTATALAGQQTNVGTVTGQDLFIGMTVTDDNPANYFGQQSTTDFNADGKADIFWQTDGGALAIWLPFGFQISFADFTRLGASAVGLPGLDWHVIDTSDVSGDGKTDILWRTDAGKLAVWQMDGSHIVGADFLRIGATAINAPALDWHPLGSADFDGDGKGDLLWRTDGGQLAIWELNGSQIQGADFIKVGNTNVGVPAPDWRIVGTGDFGGDGKADILWETTGGALALWQMDGTHIMSASFLKLGAANVGIPGLDWHVSDVADFDGDGKSDILWRVGASESPSGGQTPQNALPPGGGQVAIWEMNGDQIKFADYTKAGATNVGAPGLDWHLLGAEDYNGDGKADLLWQTDAGKLAVWQMDGTHVAAADYAKIGATDIGIPGFDWHVYEHKWDIV